MPIWLCIVSPAEGGGNNTKKTFCIISNTLQNWEPFFIKYINDQPTGFAQCGLRTDYVEGTESSPVGHLGDIFVKEGYRRNGHGKEPLYACEKWAKEMGCSEFDSFRSHLAMGSDEAERIICFRKRI
ncbi:MAG: GNAT family N-acetyltransferase [Ruminococcus sp.]|nr:GNAT family N-acetyltransferase [Ruminococcus sp.]